MGTSIYTWTTWDTPRPETSISTEASTIISQAISRLIYDLRSIQLVTSTSAEQPNELKKTDQELSRLRSIMWGTRDEFAKRVSATANRRNSLVPFNAIPTELAGIILASSLSIARTSPMHDHYTGLARLKELASVSSGYCRVVKSCPALWTTIRADSAADASLKLRKSGGLSLDIVGKGGTQGLALLSSYRHRWTSVDLYFNNFNDLIRFGESILKEDRPLLELVKLRRYPAAGSDHAYRYMRGYTSKSPLHVIPSTTLCHLEVEGAIPCTNGILEGLRHLEVHGVCGIGQTEAQILVLISSAPALENLIIRNVEGSRGSEVEMETVQPLAIELQALTTLELSEVSKWLRVAIFKRIHAENLKTFRVTHLHSRDWEDDGQTLPLVIQPRGQRSLLCTAIANSGGQPVTMSIEEDKKLEVEIKLDDDSIPVTFQTLLSPVHDQTWSRSLSSLPYFAELAANLQPTELRLIEDNSSNIPWSWDLLFTLPSLTSLFLSRPKESTLWLFENILAKAHFVQDKRVWACPKLTKIEFDGKKIWNYHDWPDYERRVERSLHARQTQGGLPHITCLLLDL